MNTAVPQNGIIVAGDDAVDPPVGNMGASEVVLDAANLCVDLVDVSAGEAEESRKAVITPARTREEDEHAERWARLALVFGFGNL